MYLYYYDLVKYLNTSHIDFSTYFIKHSYLCALYNSLLIAITFYLGKLLCKNDTDQRK